MTSTTPEHPIFQTSDSTSTGGRLTQDVIFSVHQAYTHDVRRNGVSETTQGWEEVVTSCQSRLHEGGQRVQDSIPCKIRQPPFPSVDPNPGFATVRYGSLERGTRLSSLSWFKITRPVPKWPSCSLKTGRQSNETKPRPYQQTTVVPS
ncbi:hypothetical protein AVEN_228305-1 [Araneus ventricosus]|uniref:Uncharacterized protein n=1 Tax=Araneus ventricosus TaxID=182803 RepID=A0A4Y2WNL1_ARAVE|nr:hypothetical protein AVEN_228305-1 [Araneus ventricosus]